VGVRGFTLLELMVVVVIVTVVSAMAIPLATEQLRDRRTQEAAERVAGLYRNARMRAMGRGSAVMVRFSPGTRGRFVMLEAQRGTSDAPVGTSDAACSALPVPSCLTPNWNDIAGNSYRELTTLDLANRGEYDRLNITMENEGGAVANLDVCFTPMGRAFFRTNTAQPLVPLTATHLAEVFRAEGSDRIGRTRRVLVLPNGAARLEL
jgi:prepilin-type N-terminal cleavage/methylation domain-containing protein